ncbi:MAG: 4-hydroxyproline epimerase [Crocinitomix sp.]|nr:4-hydroxyproline epimerase [Crocinitomix sp.]
MKHTFKCIDGHTCGNPVRIVVEGKPDLKGKTMSEKRIDFIENHDWIRKSLMFEPRGHDLQSGSFLYPPADPKNDVGIVLIETSGCLPMCGHGVIGAITIAIQEGLVIPKEKGTVRLETPAGLVVATYKEHDDMVTSVKIVNIPSFLHSQNVTVHCYGLGDLVIDIAYGGNFYGIVDPQKNYKGLQAYTADQLVRWSREVREELNNNYTFIHPEDDRIKGLSHLMWTGDVIDKNSTARNAVFYGEKAIDRSPCGTGTSARMAQWAAKGKLKKGEDFIHESIIGSTFIGRIETETVCGNYDAIIPSIEGWSKITGYNIIIVDTSDPYAYGFQVI